jgi:hypothetical protein
VLAQKERFFKTNETQKRNGKFERFSFTVRFCRFFLRFLFNRSLRDSELNINTNFARNISGISNKNSLLGILLILLMIHQWRKTHDFHP